MKTFILLILIVLIPFVGTAISFPEGSFVTSWQTTTDNESVTIPVIGDGYAYSMDWGDGTTDEMVYTESATHIYANEGQYYISITGDFPRIYFNNEGDKEKILTVLQWGDIAWASMEHAFYGCSNLNITANDAPDLSNVTNMRFMFSRCTNFNGNIGQWDVSNVTNMFSMFSKAQTFNQDIGDWDVSSVTSMTGMFGGASSFNQDIGKWDIGSVTVMEELFTGSRLSQINYDNILIGWAAQEVQSGVILDVPSYYCYGSEAHDILTEIYGWDISDSGQQCGFITTWDISDGETIAIPTIGSGYNYAVDWGDNSDPEIGIAGEATHTYTNAGIYTITISGDFPRIFFNSQENKGDILTVEQWGDIEWISMDNAFSGCENLNIVATDAPDLSNVTSMNSIFHSCTNLNGQIGHWNVSTITDMEYVFKSASSFNQDISEWDVSNVTTMGDMFDLAVSFNQDISNWNVSNVIDMNDLFQNAHSFNQDIGIWDIGQVSYMSNMFENSGITPGNYDGVLIGWAKQTVQPNVSLYVSSYYCQASESHDVLTETYGWDITDYGQHCGFITTWQTTANDESITIPTAVGETYNYNVEWGDGSTSIGQTGNATHAYEVPGIYTVAIAGDFPRVAFINAENKLKIIDIAQWGDIAWTSMRSAFSSCYNLNITATDVPDLSNVTDMSSMFNGCKALDADIGHWDVSNITDMESLFSFAYVFNGDISDWDVSNVTNMNAMFNWTSRFNADISGWDVGKVTNMSNMLRLNDFNQDISNWDVSNVTTMRAMFDSSNDFNQDISNWDVSSVTDMAYMFRSASSFNQNISNWHVSKVTDMEELFYGAKSFNQDISSWDVSSVTHMSDMFNNAYTFNQDIGNWDVSGVTDMTGMFSNASSFNQNLSNWNIEAVDIMDGTFSHCGLSKVNYDLILIGWAAQDVQMGVDFGATGLEYCAGAEARTLLMNSGWAFSGDTQNCAQVITFEPIPPRQFADPDFDLIASTNCNLEVIFASSDPSVATVSGSTITITGAGSAVITASQAGNDSYSAAEDVDQTLTVDKADQTIVFSVLENKTFGDDAFELTATGGDSGNALTFVSSNLSVATISGSTATIVGLGSTTITASQAGNNNYNAAEEVQQTLTITKADQTITFEPLESKTFGDEPFELSASGGDSGNVVTFVSSDLSVVTISGSTVTVVGVGSTTIIASQGGNENYSAAEDVQQTLTVNKVNQIITFAALSDRTIGDDDFELTASASSGLGVSFSSTDESVATVSGSIVTIVGEGSTVITAEQPGNQNYGAADDVPQTLTILPLPLSIKKDWVQELSYYPNPAKNLLVLEWNNHYFGDMQLKISNSSGQILYSQTITKGSAALKKHEIDISQFTNGIYLIEARTKGDRMITRIIKE